EPYEIADAPDCIDEFTYVNVPLYRGQVPLAAAIDDVYRLLLIDRGNQIAAAVQTICHYVDCGVVVHCKAGKDRTGLVVALLMATVGVSTEAITADYAQSAENLSPAYRRQMTRQLETQLAGDPTGFKPPCRYPWPSQEPALRLPWDRLIVNIDSANKYLAAHGVTGAQFA